MARHLKVGTVRKGWKVVGHDRDGGNKWAKHHGAKHPKKKASGKKKKK